MLCSRCLQRQLASSELYDSDRSPACARCPVHHCNDDVSATQRALPCAKKGANRYRLCAAATRQTCPAHHEWQACQTVKAACPQLLASAPDHQVPQQPPRLQRSQRLPNVSESVDPDTDAHETLKTAKTCCEPIMMISMNQLACSTHDTQRRAMYIAAITAIPIETLRCI
jgi:hypothetical protein